MEKRSVNAWAIDDKFKSINKELNKISNSLDNLKNSINHQSQALKLQPESEGVSALRQSNDATSDLATDKQRGAI